MKKANKNTGLKRVSFYITPQLDLKLQELKASRGDTHESDTLKESVRVHHAKVFPAYLSPRSGDEPLDKPEDRKTKIKNQIIDKDIRKKAKKEMLHDNQVAICDALGGTVVGSKCRYYTYDHKLRYEQETPLSMLTEEIVVKQYQPSREKVEQLQRDGKTHY